MVLSVEEYERLKALDMGTKRPGTAGAEAKRGGRPLERMDKQSLTERDIYTKFITPAVRAAGWDEMLQLREEVTFTAGRMVVRGRLMARRKRKRADYILYVKPNIPIAVIEAKDNTHGVGDGMQRALELMALCDRLEEARVVREDTRDQLLDSLLHEALLADDALAERSTQFDWLPVGRHD